MDIKNIIKAIKKNPGSKITIVNLKNEKITKTFRQFSQDVEKITKLLTSSLSERSRVGTIGDNCYEWMVWDIAIINSNMLPLALPESVYNHDYSELLKKYNLAILVVHDNIIKSADKNIIPMSLDIEGLNLESSKESKVDHENNILTYAFSSGTTGRLKGLIISVSGTNHIINEFVDTFKITTNDVYFSFLSFSYYQQRALYYCALFYGVDITVSNQINLIQDLRVSDATFIIAPPVFHETIYNISINSPDKKNYLKELLGGNIRFMITAMAPIKKHIIEYFWENKVSLYETYAVTETGMVTWNTFDNLKIGTVGKESEKGTILFTDENEILVKRKLPLSLGYFDSSEEDEAETFRSDGAVSTGDIGVIDEDGFIKIVGRKKNAIITAEGKKFHPEEIEVKFNNISCVSDYVDPVFIGGANVCENTIVVSKKENKKILLDKVMSELMVINDGLPIHKKIKRLLITEKVFSYENKYRTRNLKLDRTNITNDLLKGELGKEYINIQ